MNFICSIIFVVLATVSVVSSKPESDFAVHELLARSNADNCFTNYMQYNQNVTMKYQVKYNACDQTYDQEKVNIETATLEKHNRYASNADTSCNALFACKELRTAEEILKCVAEGGSQSARTMYNLNLDASKNLVDLKEKLRLAENKKYNCGNETSEHMKEEMDRGNVHLTQCMLGVNNVWPVVDESA